MSLLIVQRSIEYQVRRNLRLDLANSVETFRNFQKEREESLARSAQLMADLPVLKALMTTPHVPTIQDGSTEFFRLSGGDLFALVDRRNQIVGFHTRAAGVTLEQAQVVWERRPDVDSAKQWWWFGEGHLYEVFLAPIYFGPESSNSVLGTVAIGYEINQNVAHELARVASGQVAVVCAGSEVVSTVESSEVQKLQKALAARNSDEPVEVKLGNESFVVASLALNRGEPPITIYVMKSYDQAAQFLSHLRQLLLFVGLGGSYSGACWSTFWPAPSLAHWNASSKACERWEKATMHFRSRFARTVKSAKLLRPSLVCGKIFIKRSNGCCTPSASPPSEPWPAPFPTICAIR